MQHLIETERSQQRKSFEEERESTHTLLKSVQEKLKVEQKRILGEAKSETTKAVNDVEEKLKETNLAKSIEDVVKKKLSKRIAELESAGEKTVHDVSEQVAKLKDRVSRLRRENARMRVKEAKMETMMESRSHESRDLGESASIHSSMSEELQRMQMQQMMQMQQQPKNSAEHEELMQLKEELAAMRMQQQMQPPQMQPQMQMQSPELLQMKQQMSAMANQNELLQQLLQSQTAKPLAPLGNKPQYTSQGLQTYFSKRRQRDSALMRQRVAESSPQPLNQVAASAITQANPADDDMLVQLSEGAEQSAAPLFNQLAEQHRVQSEDMRQHALDERDRKSVV